MNKGEISQVDEDPSGLPNDEYRIFSVNRVSEKPEATGKAEVPKGQGDHAFFLVFGNDPLEDKTAEKHCLSK